MNPTGEFEDRQQAKREQEMMRARNKVTVYAVTVRCAGINRQEERDENA